jgi:outer membrane protein assembly factor BamB
MGEKMKKKMHNSTKAKTTSLMVLLVSVFLLSALAGVGKVSAAWPYDWPMARHDLQHTGYSASPAPSTNQTLWTYTTGGIVVSSPAVVDGKVYVGSADNNVYCLDHATGALIWNYTTSGIVYSSPAVADGKVYIGSGDTHSITGLGNVYCLNAANGAYIWNYSTPNPVGSGPAVVDGKVYIGSSDKNVYCLDAATGALIWNYTTGVAVYGAPAVANGKVYIGSYDNNVYCLDASTGAYIWNYTAGGDIAGAPAVADDKVYVGSYDNFKVHCINATSGAFIWSYTTGGPIYYASVANGVVYVSSIDRKVYAFSAAPPIPEGLTIGIMLTLSTIAVIVSIRYFRKQPKIKNCSQVKL